MKKKYWLILLIVMIGIGGIIFYKNRVKNSKSGNNKTSQEIVDYILNISSYEVQVTVNVASNKNSNKYIQLIDIVCKYICTIVPRGTYIPMGWGVENLTPYPHHTTPLFLANSSPYKKFLEKF